LILKDSLYVAVSVETSKFETFFLVGLLGVQTTLESPFRTAAPSLAKVNVQLNLFFPDFTDAFTTSLSAETQDRAKIMNPKEIMIESLELLMLRLPFAIA
jgi:hypothetical protein